MASFNVFGASVPDAVNENDSDSYSLGTVVLIDSVNGGQVTHARWYFPTTPPSGPVAWRLSELASGDILGSHIFAGTGPGWVEEALSSPISIPPGEYNVLPWIGTPDRYVATGTYFTTGAGAAGIVSGPLTAPASAADPQAIGNGRFGGDPDSVPGGTINGGNYFVDLVFEEAAPPPNEGTAALGLELAVAATGDAPTVLPNEGSAALGLTFAVAATGDAPALPANEGSAALGINFAFAGTGETPAVGPSQGVAALGLGLAVAAVGSAPSSDPSEGTSALGLSFAFAGTGFTPGNGEGSAALTLGLAVAAIGGRDSSGEAALGLNFAVAAVGSNGTEPVIPCRPVRSFSEVMPS